MSLSPALLDHFNSPRNVGEMDRADAEAEAENPVCGDRLHLWLSVDNGVIRDARWKAQGCPPAIACASVVSQLLIGMPLAEAEQISAEDVERAVGGLPPRKGHAAALAITAVRQAIGRYTQSAG